MSNYTHLTASERDQIADLNSVGSGVQAIAAALGRSASTISRELQRNALDSGAYRPVPAEGAYLLRRQRPAKLERDNKLRSYVLARLSEGWTPEQICGRLRQGIERGLGLISTEAIYAWIYSKARKADRLWAASLAVVLVAAGASAPPKITLPRKPISLSEQRPPIREKR